MRVVEVAFNWPAEVFIQRHLEAVSGEGQLETTFVVRHKNSDYAEVASVQANSQRVACVMPNYDHLPAWAKVANLRHLWAAPRLLFNRMLLRDRVLLAYFHRLRPHLIHFHTVTLATGMYWIPQALGIPYTISLRGSDVQVDPLRSLESRQAIAGALQGAAAIHTVCDHLGRRAAALAPAAPSATTIYTTLPVPASLPEYPPVGDGGLRLLSAGRIHWTKSYPDLLLALRGLLDRGIPASLTLVGSGPDQPRLEYWLQRLDLREHVRCIGKASFADIQALFAGAHAYVQSSLAEGFSNSLAEAMSWGCPVFATDVGGTAELVRHGVNGYLLPPLQAEQWPETLRLALDRPAMLDVRARAHQTAGERFAPQVHSRQFVDFYRRACQDFEPARRSPRAAPLPPPPAGEPLEQRPQILIRGPWQWQHGADLVLRALGALPSRNFSILLAGSGAQRDELCYLLDLLGLSGLARFALLPDETPRQTSGSCQALAGAADITVDITRAGRWQVHAPGFDHLLNLGDHSSLQNILAQALGA